MPARRMPFGNMLGVELAELIASKLMSGMHTHLELILTTKCNLRCSYCFESRANRTRSMTQDIGTQAIKSFVKPTSPVSQDVVFFGGEPFLEWDLFSKLLFLARELQPSPRRLGLSTVTNATIIPASAISILRETDVVVMVSLDPGKNAHDANRRFNNALGTYEVVLKNMYRLLQENIPIVVRSTVVPGSTECLMDTYSFLQSMGVRKWYISRATGVEWNMQQVRKLENAFRKLIMKYFEDIKSFPDGMRVAQFEYMLQGVINEPCMAGKYGIAVNPEGWIYGCSRLALLGDISECFRMGKTGTLSDEEDKVSRLRHLIVNYGCPAINYDETSCFDANSLGEVLIKEALHRLQKDVLRKYSVF